MWSYVLYGSSSGSNDIVEIAKQYIGNVGGQPFWSWYGFINRIADNKVYPIEGNISVDMCKQNVYNVGSSVILGYGTPNYQNWRNN